MKMYFFHPHTFAEHWTVMAHDEVSALEILLTFLEDVGYYNLPKWRTATVDNLPGQYTIDEYDEGCVIQGEIS